jgi:hypothetical protein
MLAQAAPVALQNGRLPPPSVLAQHGCPVAPQVPQLPLAHAPATCGHIEPELAHTSCTQQPPPEQALPGQHACPAPPHAAHTSLVQAVPLPH